jgi:hypothetical protein
MGETGGSCCLESQSKDHFIDMEYLGYNIKVGGFDGTE